MSDPDQSIRKLRAAIDEGLSSAMENLARCQEVASSIDKTLWCVSVVGPDDVHACASKLDALEMANALNVFFVKQQEADHHEYDPIMRAIVIPWEYDAESHAEDLRKAALTAKETPQ